MIVAQDIVFRFSLRDGGLDRRKFNHFELLSLKRSLIRYGQLRPLIITKDHLVIEGRKLLKAMELLKVEKVWVSFVDDRFDPEELRLILGLERFDSDHDPISAEIPFPDDPLVLSCTPYSPAEKKFWKATVAGLEVKTKPFFFEKPKEKSDD